MEISECRHDQIKQLKIFKDSVWPVADREHYGECQPDFFRKEFTLVAKEGDEIVGYVSVTVDSGVAQIEPLMVSHKKRGQGIGKALLKAAEEKANDLGAHKLWLETGVDWSSRYFYEKQGYGVRALLPNHVGGREFVLMDKML